MATERKEIIKKIENSVQNTENLLCFIYVLCCFMDYDYARGRI